MNNDARQLITALHRGGTYGYWWVAEGRRSSWWEVGKATPIPSGRVNVYVGVHPVAAIPDTNSRGEAAESIYVRSQINGISVLNCLFAEYDAKDFAHDKAATLAHIDTLAPSPSAVVDSGGGYHCYWLLKQPYPLTTPDARRDAVKLQAAWVTLMGSDKASKDLARVLRVPGTHNHKYDPPRPVALLRFTDTRYAIAELAALAAPFVEPDKPHTIANGSMPAERYVAAALAGETAKVITAPEGQKHYQLFKSAAALGELAGAGMVDEQTVKDLLFSAIAPRAADTKNAANTIRDGVAKGKTNPRQLPAPRTSAHGQIVRNEDAPQVKPVGPVHYVEAKRQPISAAELQRVQFAPLKWIVDGILPEGATLLAGKPKSKKSWKALAVAAAVAMGGKVLGYYDTLQGEVLYLDLESNQRRMQGRLNVMLGAIPWPQHFYIETAWERGEEGIAMLDAWMEAHPNTKLVVIDILQNFRPARDPKGNPYDQDYDAVKMINAFAERHRIAVLIIHHTRKAKSDDVFDEISGTTGLSGGVASMWVLGRTPDNSGESILAIRGRDISDDDPMALKWDNYTCQFIRVASGQEASSGSARRQILDAMDEHQQYQLKELAAAVGKSMSATSNHIRRLMDDNLIERVGNGKYARIVQPVPYLRESAESRESAEAFQGKVSHDFHDAVRNESQYESHVKVTLAHQDAPNDRSKSDFHDFHRDSHSAPDLYIDEVETPAGVVFRIWDEMSQTHLAGDYATRNEAAAEAQRRMR